MKKTLQQGSKTEELTLALPSRQAFPALDTSRD